MQNTAQILQKREYRVRTGVFEQDRAPIEPSDIWKSMKRLAARAGAALFMVFSTTSAIWPRANNIKMYKGVLRLADVLARSIIGTTRIYKNGVSQNRNTVVHKRSRRTGRAACAAPKRGKWAQLPSLWPIFAASGPGVMQKNQDFLKFPLLFSVREAIIITVKLGSKEVFSLLLPQNTYSVARERARKIIILGG